jgi:hypothetical protein
MRLHCNTEVFTACEWHNVGSLANMKCGPYCIIQLTFMDFMGGDCNSKHQSCFAWLHAEMEECSVYSAQEK